MSQNMQEFDYRLETMLHSDFHVGPWLAQPDLNRLQLRHTPDLVRSLEPRIMLLLCVLATDAGKVVSREILMSKLWPRVVVNENSLTRAVSELRKALVLPDGNGTSPVTTIPKKGYQLNIPVAPAALPEPAAAAEAIPIQVMTEIIRPQARPSVWMSIAGARPGRLQALAASLAFAVGILIWQGQGDGAAVGAMDAEVATVQDDMSRVAGTSAATPAGTGRGQASAEWIREQLRAHRVEGMAAAAPETETVNPDVPAAADASTSIFSRDGRLFAYVNYTDSGSALVLGSRDSFSPVNVYETDELIFNLQWSPVDNVLLFAQKPKISPASLLSVEEPVRLVMFDIATMEATVLQGGGKNGARNPFSLT